jgi:3-deoxy-D-manno-octulosonic-acid transferase
MHWFLNALYVYFLCCAAPVWLWKLPSARRYRAGIVQRAGLAPWGGDGHRRLWIHCASVGEASIPRELVKRLLENHPKWELYFSTWTDTGAQRLKDLYPEHTVFYWPLDLSPVVERALVRVDPDAVLLTEQEIWPNFMLACRRMKIPVAIINGRINPSSVVLLRGVHRLLRGLFDPLVVCCARSDEDARRFADAGVPPERVIPTGSLKYDALPTEVDPSEQKRLRNLFGIEPAHPVLVAGSTHPGEDELLCKTWSKLRDTRPQLRLILVPRHIERAEDLAGSIRGLGHRVARKTTLETGRETPSEDHVLIVDTIGDLMTCYALADCVFVGRSLLPPGGGQNMMEPAALGKPVLLGPYTSNFRPEMELLRTKDAVWEVNDPNELTGAVRSLLENPDLARNLGRRARQTVLQSRGAARRTLRALENALAIGD